MNRTLSILTLASLIGATFVLRNLAADTAAAPLGIPLKPDPPPAIDGDLGEWGNVPNALDLNTKEQVVWGEGKWTSPNDLRAIVWLAWRNEYLFLAADVTDDKFQQTQRGTSLWKGDHIELFIDATPDTDSERKPFGKGQFQFGFSPGNFQHTGDKLLDLPPEAVIFRPTEMKTDGILTAATRTESGYALEAAIPWSLLGVEGALATALGIEVGVSDTDGDESVQESMMTIRTDRWEITRNRLVPAVLSPTTGEAPPIVRGIGVFESIEVKPDEKKQIPFESPKVPAGKVAVFSLKARLAHPKPAGYTPSMRLTLNGTILDAKRLVNKKPTETRVDGAAKNMAAGDLFYIDYSPDFDAPDKSESYALRHGKVCQFDLNITDLLAAKDNVLVIENAIGHGMTKTLHVGEGKLEFRAPVVEEKKRPAPTGSLPMRMPSGAKIGFTVEKRADNDFAITVSPTASKGGMVRFAIDSRFSTPEPKWQKGSNDYFKLERKIEKQAEAVIVRDTFTNLTNENLPLMQRHRVALGAAGKSWDKVWLGGLSSASGTGTVSKPENPSSYGVSGKAGIGVLPLDDVFQVHSTNFSDGDAIGLADHNFVLKPKATHTAEWVVVPTDLSGCAIEDPVGISKGITDEPYFSFVNAARRVRNVNFPVVGPFAFLRSDPRLTGRWSDEQLVNFVTFKSARYLSTSIGYPSYKGHAAHGTAFQAIDHSIRRDHILRLRKLAPDAEHQVYFHCYIDVSDGAEEKYADARGLKSDGTQADYGQPYYRIFFPTEDNSYGPQIRKNVDLILGKEIGADGVYWDEMEYSAYQYHYGEPWDGVSADIDPKTMKISRLKSSVTLITQPWRIALAKEIMAKGSLIANGQPHTRSMASLRFSRFVETGSISNCARAQLYSPIALGDHLTERSELDAYLNMLRALDYGCVYHWYNDMTVIPTHHTLTKYMFPVTPIELHEGYIIGEERILTNRSGVFGWNDGSGHEVHVFDAEGREVDATNISSHARTTTRGGKTATEIRIAEDWSAAIVRKKQR